MQLRGKKFVNISAVIGVVIVLHYLGLTASLENYSRRAVSGGISLIYRAAIYLSRKTEEGVFPAPKACLPGGRETIEYQKDFELKKARVSLLEEENSSLRSSLGFFSSSTYRHVGADVIGRNIDPVDTAIIINSGRDAGIRINDPVVVGDGILIGKVGRVMETTAIVRLIDDTNSRVAAMVAGMNKSLGLVEGGYGVSVRLGFVPQNEIIKPGDMVVSSGLEPNMPRGLGIGIIEIVEKKPQEAFQQAILKTLADLRDIKVVSVIIDTGR
ncbi:MAG: rod shape-determining protein MreC [Patescibacteria group bacterium]